MEKWLLTITCVQIRISAYILCLGGPYLAIVLDVLPGHHSLRFERSYGNACAVNALALLITDCSQVARNSLTFFHAIITIFLMAMLGVNMPYRPSYNHSRITKGAIRLLFACAVLTSITFEAYIWSRRNTLSQPECNDALANRPPDPGGSPQPLATSPGFTAITWFVALIQTAGFQGFCCSESALWNSAAGRRISLLVALYISGICVHRVETMTSGNPVSEQEKEWTFGQVLAACLLIGPAFEFLRALSRVIDGLLGESVESQSGEETLRPR